MIEYPKALLDFLQNIKSLSEGDLPEQENTYTQENLLRLFGAREVNWHLNDAGIKKGEMVGYESFIEDVKHPNGNVFPGMSLHFFFRIFPDHKLSRINIHFTADSKVSFSEIEKIFGTNWELNEDEIKQRAMQITEGRVFQSSTHPMGNKPLIYRLGKGQNQKFVAFELSEIGNLESMQLVAKRSAE